MNTTLKVIVAAALAIIVGAVGFVGGFAVANTGSQELPEAVEQDVLPDRVTEVRELLDREALKPPSETSATAGAIQGLLDSGGDKYGLYFDAKHFEFFNEESAGEFGGIGVVLGEKEGSAYVVEVYRNTPAARAGVKAGDFFVSINGVRREKWATEEVVKRVRGKEGTKVKITMLRPNKADSPALTHPGGELGKEYTVSVTRAMIELPNVESKLKGDVGYIRVGQFNAKTSTDISSAIRSLGRKGAKSFVLDLRDNPGGLLSQAVDVSSLFIDGGTVVRIDERNKPQVQERTTGEKVTDAPLVLLVNGNSASASEIVAGCLQDYGRAKLVGEKTFGKGSVQTIKQLSFGGAVKFTIAHYLTPKGRVIDGKGVAPDVIVPMDPAKQAEESTDLQLKRALQVAKTEAAK